MFLAFFNMTNIQIAKLYFEEIWNNRNEEIAYKIISDELKTRFPKTLGNGPKGLLNVVNERYKVFPNLAFNIIDTVSEKDKIWVLYNFTATHKGKFWNITGTNKKVNFNGVLMMKITDSKVVKATSIRDELTLLRQVGFINIEKDDRQ